MSIDGWVDGPSPQRERYKKPPGEPTELISFRLPVWAIRFIAEIVEGKQDVQLKCRTDCLNDAVFSWLDDRMEERPEQFSARSRREFYMEKLKLQRHSRDRFLQEWDEEFEAAKSNRDPEALNVLIHCIEAEQHECDPMSPDAYIDDLNKRHFSIKRLLVD